VIDDVIVGHRVAVGRNEEARAFAGDGLAALRHAILAPLAALPTLAELVAELPEELFHRRAGLERNGALVVAVAVLLEHRGLGGGDLHAHRDNGGFDLGDDVGEAGRMLQGRVSGACGGGPGR